MGCSCLPHPMLGAATAAPSQPSWGARPGGAEPGRAPIPPCRLPCLRRLQKLSGYVRGARRALAAHLTWVLLKPLPQPQASPYLGVSRGQSPPSLLRARAGEARSGRGVLGLGGPRGLHRPFRARALGVSIEPARSCRSSSSVRFMSNKYIKRRPPRLPLFLISTRRCWRGPGTPAAATALSPRPPAPLRWEQAVGTAALLCAGPRARAPPSPPGTWPDPDPGAEGKGATGVGPLHPLTCSRRIPVRRGGWGKVLLERFYLKHHQHRSVPEAAAGASGKQHRGGCGCPRLGSAAGQHPGARPAGC